MHGKLQQQKQLIIHKTAKGSLKAVFVCKGLLKGLLLKFKHMHMLPIVSW